jgi:hypothetical protein
VQVTFNITHLHPNTSVPALPVMDGMLFFKEVNLTPKWQLQIVKPIMVATIVELNKPTIETDKYDIYKKITAYTSTSLIPN